MHLQINIYLNVALQKGLQKIYKCLKFNCMTERSFTILETTWNSGKVNVDSTAWKRLSKSSIPNDVRSNSRKEVMSGVFFCSDIRWGLETSTEAARGKVRNYDLYSYEYALLLLIVLLIVFL